MAGPYYVRSSAATPTSPFTGWGTAAATLAAALGVAAAGERIYVADDHSETQASVMNLVSAGTVGAPVLIICTAHTHTPPLAADLTTTAIVATTLASSIIMSGVAISIGVTYSAGSGASSASINTGEWTFENTGLTLNNTSASAKITPSIAGWADWINTVVTFGNASQTINANLSSVLRWRGSTSAVAGVAPNSLFTTSTVTKVISASVQGVDLSLCAGTSTLFGGSIACPVIAQVVGCKLGAGVTLASAPTVPGTTIDLISSDSGAVTSNMGRAQYQGLLTTSTSTFLRAADDLNSFSWHIDTTGGVPSFTSPFEAPPIMVELAAGARTVTVEIASTNALTNADVWMTIDYMGTAASVRTTPTTTRAANVLTAGVALTSSAAVWTNAAGLNTYKLVLSFTTTEPGYIRINTKVATAQTLYVDPAPATT